MKITQLWRYPVKSLGGEQVSSCSLTELGLEGDRGWGLFAAETGKVLTARRVPQLLFASASYQGPGEVSIVLPDGTETADDAVLSRWLEQDVQLIAPGAEGGTYECPIDPGVEQEWVEWQGPAGSFHDSGKSRVSLVSEATLGNWDCRRFRTNIVTDGSGEDAWVGSSVSVGAAKVDVIKQIDRCVMITRPQPGIEKDLAILKEINAERATFLAVGALITTPATVSVGDEVSCRLGS